MTPDGLRAGLRAAFEAAFNRRDPDALDALFAPNVADPDLLGLLRQLGVA